MHGSGSETGARALGTDQPCQPCRAIGSAAANSPSHCPAPAPCWGEDRKGPTTGPAATAMVIDQQPLSSDLLRKPDATGFQAGRPPPQDQPASDSNSAVFSIQISRLQTPIWTLLLRRCFIPRHRLHPSADTPAGKASAAADRGGAERHPRGGAQRPAPGRQDHPGPQLQR